MENLKSALTRKRVVKGNLTRLKDKINNCVKEADAAELELLLAKIRTISNELSSIFANIYDGCKEDEFDVYFEENTQIQDNIDELLLLLNRELSLRSNLKNSLNDSNNASIVKPEPVDLKLPRLCLPVFNGQMDEWLNFKDLFLASVHNNRSLSNAQRLSYLKSSCKNYALNIIQSIPITDTNYEIAWDLLVDRFSNKRELVNSIIKRLIDHQNVNESAQSILSLVDVTNECVRSLQVLEQDVSGFSDTLIVYILVKKLDKNTRTWWERSLKKDSLGSLEELLVFLKDHVRTLQAGREQTDLRRNHSKITSLVLETYNCLYCRENSHNLQKCSKFLNLPVEKRCSVVKNKGLCFNCLSSQHKIKGCKSKYSCRICHKFHNTVLHFDKGFVPNRAQTHGQSSSALSPQSEVFTPSTPNSSGLSVNDFTNNSSATIYAGTCASNIVKNDLVLLCTAIINVQDSSGNFVPCRALLDPGSQASFITDNCLQRLGLERRKARIPISCLGSANTHTNGVSSINFNPHFTSASRFSTSVFVISKIIRELPHVSLEPSICERYKDLVLSDPTFYKCGPVDILLGISVALPMLKGDVIKYGQDLPFAVRSDLGWIISGSVSIPFTEAPLYVNNIQLSTDELASSFWKMEAVPEATLLTKEEQQCEDIYKNNYTRDQTGRYIVKLPFNASPELLGDSRKFALYRLQCLESKLLKSPELYDQYRDFLQQYLNLGHMEKVPESSNPQFKFYFPHHPVFKDSSSTTKLRVVFDASAKSSSGVSLNDILMVGPRIQQELFPILLRFRMFPVALCADVEKMFRQIKVHEEDTDFQRILWRDNPSEPIAEYRLLTVTYGTAPAPYLSSRSLKQLALDEQDNFPLASTVTLRDFYVDDLLSGAETAEEASELVKQLSEMMEEGGFKLRKWSSNLPAVLERFPEELKEPVVVLEGETQVVKVLGINWHPNRDMFDCSMCTKNNTSKYTKRSILSVVARIFDPLGFLAPCVVLMKIILQELWKYEISWDEPIIETLNRKMMKIYDELKLLKCLRIPRFVIVAESVFVQAHGFCDASERAYCAAIYIRSVNRDSHIKVTLLTSKTRVAPLKLQSLPRLELCAALLLANLFEVVLKNIGISCENTFAWTDSTVTLCWIKSEPRRWQSFVANRVARIQEAIPKVQWNHVRSHENPADCATRGLLPSELLKCDLWFSGPDFLKEQSLNQTNPEFDNYYDDRILKEEKKIFTGTVTNCEKDFMFDKFSSWSKLCRVTAWCLRFFHNASKPPSERNKDHLTRDELNNAIANIVKRVQGSGFSDELTVLKTGRSLKPNSRILSLTPFLDSIGIMRVGGRLRNAAITEDHKHPMILPKNHHTTDLLIKYFHDTYLHGGPQLLIAVIRQRFWIIGARDAIRRCVRQCVTCCRHSAELSTQIMADLPASRVVQGRAFSRVGVDFAGPFNIIPRRGRGVKSFKCYVSLFVCFITRAIHLEVVGDLSAQSFLATLKRFVSRRGKPSEIYSDCGTNFVGASREIRKIITSLNKDEQLHGYVATENITWRFNPPSAPHFGGLWEAGVKSMKYHLKRVLGASTPTYEEFVTLITQIEACLNSRPLVPASSDPNDLEVLTPAHFLIGTSLTAMPESVISENLSICDRWKNTQRIFQHFWKRWSSEYLSRLQQRPKWLVKQRDIQLGDLVLIKNENFPPMQWKLGRITKVYPGKDNRVRVVDLQTSTGELKRPISKLCALPFSD